jgi:diaminopropionate ammonia-lyase
MDTSQITYDKELVADYLKSKKTKNKLGKLTFTTATDGNHGRDVAWAASKLGHKAVIYLPKNSAKNRFEAIEDAGGKAVVTNLNYDDTVDFVLQKAEAENWILVQDTARDEYLKIPHWIMQGYTTMVQEVELQLELEALEKTTHLFLQAGVGSMAAAILGYYQNLNDKNPITTIIEPKEAACFYESAAAADSKAHKASGNLKTDMAGLACGEANPIAWNILRDYADFFISCSDYPAARAMRILANPIAEDDKIISGESGSVGLGVLSLLMEINELKKLKEKLQLDQNSTLLFFNTEGATDEINYRKIVWDGKNSLLD